MNITLLKEGKVWPELTAAAQKARRRAYVAVAYFGQGAARMLPLPDGSHLVVNASEGAVKSGQTCPDELNKLLNKGVHIYTVANLHAKVFVLGNKCFVGSANVSRHSADALVEAMLVTSYRDTVVAARDFVKKHCWHELGPEVLAGLSKMYKPPRFAGAKRSQRAKSKQKGSAELPPVSLVQLVDMVPPKDSKRTEEEGRKVAVKRQKHPNRYRIENFWEEDECHYHKGDIVIKVLEEDNGCQMITRPGTVVHTRAWRRGNRSVTFVYVEVPKGQRVELKRLAKRLGQGTEKRLRRNGHVAHDFARELLDIWKP